MEERKRLDPGKIALQERINILKADGYRGFRVSDGEIRKADYAIEMGARNNVGEMVIGVGKTQEEAYEKLIERIDSTLDGMLI